MEQPGQLSERFEQDVLIFTHSVPKECRSTIGPRRLQQFPKGSPQRERERFGAAETKLLEIGGRSSPPVGALSLASWEKHATRRVRTLQAFLPSLSSCVPTVDAALRR